MTKMKVVKSKLIIDGTGAEPIKDGVILIENDRITQVCHQSEVKIPKDAEIIDLSDQTVLPGLIETHQHLMPMDGRHYFDKVRDPEAYKALWATRTIREDVRTGVTTMRLMGQHGFWTFDIQKAIESNVIAGPRILNAGKAPRAPDGHGWMGTPCSGVENIRRLLRENFARGATCAKIFISGGMHSPSDRQPYGARLLESYYSKEEIEVAVEEAHRRGAKIGAHLYGGLGAKWFIEAGGDSVEHGGLLNEELMDLMIEKNTYLSITQPGGLPPYITSISLEWEKDDKKFQEAVERRKPLKAKSHKLIKKAIDKGVKYTTNQDISYGGLPWNIVGLVNVYKVSPMEAILANTKNAAECCGILDIVGTLEPGKYADIISVKGNPLEDIMNIKETAMVMIGGKIYDPKTGYWKGLEARGFQTSNH